MAPYVPVGGTKVAFLGAIPKQKATSGGEAPVDVVGAGEGGIDEMVRYVKDDQVLWLLLRFSVGSGAFKRSKIVLVHFNGDSCPVILRGKCNSMIAEIKDCLAGGSHSGECIFHACISFNLQNDLTLENVMKEVSTMFIVDDSGASSTAEMMKAYYDQLEADRRARVEADDETRAKRRAATEKRLEAEAERKERKARTMSATGTMTATATSETSVHAADTEVTFDSIETVEKAPKKKIVFWRPPGEDEENEDPEYSTAADALKALAAGESWNWVLLGPDVEGLPLLGGGTGSVDELRECAETKPGTVIFGALRMRFGLGKLTRTKFAFVHILGSAVPAVARGKLNAVRPKMESFMKEFVNFSVSFTDMSAEDCTPEAFIERIKKVSIVDEIVVDEEKSGGAEAEVDPFSVEAFQLALQREQEAAEKLRERKEEEERLAAQKAKEEKLRTLAQAGDVEGVPAPQEPSVPNAGAAVSKTLEMLAVKKIYNWAIFAPRLPTRSRSPSPARPPRV